MKRCMIVAAVLAAVLIGFTGCPNPAGKADDNPPSVTPSTPCPLIAGKTYNVGCYIKRLCSGNEARFSERAAGSG